MLTRVAGMITGGIAFVAGVRIMVIQFTDPRGVQSFAVGMRIALLIGGTAAVIMSLRQRR